METFYTNTTPVNSREAYGLVAVIIHDPYIISKCCGEKKWSGYARLKHFLFYLICTLATTKKLQG